MDASPSNFCGETSLVSDSAVGGTATMEVDRGSEAKEEICDLFADF
jgi:hypothetical protein